MTKHQTTLEIIVSVKVERMAYGLLCYDLTLTSGGTGVPISTVPPPKPGDLILFLGSERYLIRSELISQNWTEGILQDLAKDNNPDDAL